MEIHELRQVIDQRFEDLNKNLTTCFKSIDDKNVVTDKAIENLTHTVISHDRWLWAMRGIVTAIIIVMGWMGIKVKF